MVKHVVIGVFLFFSVPGLALQVDYQFSNNAMLEYGFSRTDTYNSLDTIYFHNASGTLLWHLPLRIDGLTVNHFKHEGQEDKYIAKLDAEKRADVGWNALGRHMYVSMGRYDELIPVVSGAEKFLVSSRGEIIPIETDLGVQNFIEAEWMQSRWELPNGQIYRAVATFTEKTTTAPGKINKLIMIRENDWTYQNVVLDKLEVQEIMFHEGLRPYFNKREVSFNLADFLKYNKETGRALPQIALDLSKFDKKISMSPALSALLTHNSQLFENERAVLVRESKPFGIINKEGQPVDYAPAAPAWLDFEIKQIGKVQSNLRFSKYINLGPKLVNNGKFRQLPLEQSRALALFVIEDLINLPGQADIPVLLPEDERAIHNFLSDFFLGLNESQRFYKPLSMQDLIKLAEFRDIFNGSYQRLIISGFQSVPDWPHEFTKNNYATVFRLLQMSQNLTKVPVEVLKVLDRYMKPSNKTDNDTLYPALKQAIQFTLAIKEEDKTAAYNFSRMTSSAADLKVIVDAFPVDLFVLRSVSDRLKVLSGDPTQQKNREEYQKLLSSVESLRAIAFRPSKIDDPSYFNSLSRQVENAILCDKELLELRELILKKTGT